MGNDYAKDKAGDGKDRKRVVVIISANAEWQVVRDLFQKDVFYTSPYGEWFQTAVEAQGGASARPDRLSFQEVIFFQGGWGKISAAGSTQYLIDRWKPDLLVNLGTCGGFEEAVARGEVILVEKTLVYDIIEQMGDFDEAIAAYTVEIDMSWLDEPYPQKVRRTLLVSGDRDLLPEDIPTLKSRYGAIAGDWESGAIAFVAARNKTRLLILRGVTDLVGSSGGEAYGKLEVFQRATRELMGQLIKALPEWIQKAT